MDLAVHTWMQHGLVLLENLIKQSTTVSFNETVEKNKYIGIRNRNQ